MVPSLGSLLAISDVETPIIYHHLDPSQQKGSNHESLHSIGILLDSVSMD